jgi:hypothetical protein
LPKYVVDHLLSTVWSIQDFASEVVHHNVISVIQTLDGLLFLTCNRRHQGLVIQNPILL